MKLFSAKSWGLKLCGPKSYRKMHVFWLALLLAGIIASFVSAVERHKVENSSRQVELVLDYDSLLELAARSGTRVPMVLEMVKNTGITSIGLPEMTLERLKSAGEISWFSGKELIGLGNIFSVSYPIIALQKEAGINPQHLYVVNGTPFLLQTIEERFRLLLGSNRVIQHKNILEILGRHEELKDFGLGLYSPEAKLLESKGFLIVPRFENKDALIENKIRFLFGTLDSLNSVSTVIFSGTRNEALGYPDFDFFVADELRKKKLRFGFVETYDNEKVQKGAKDLVRLLPNNTVKVQTITPSQMLKLDPKQALDMWKLGVRERNIRLLYLRPFVSIQLDGDGGEKNLLDGNLKYFERVAIELKAQGFTIGKASVFPEFKPLFPIMFLAGSGIVACIFLFLGESRVNECGVNVSQKCSSIICLVPFGLLFVFSSLIISNFVHLLDRPPAFPFIALFAGLVFPLFGSLIGWRWLRKYFYINRSASFLSSLGQVTLAALFMTLVSVIGGLVIGAILRGEPYLLGADQFRGVKLILLLPPTIVAILLYNELGNGIESKNGRLTLKGNRFLELLRTPVLLWQVAILALLAGIFFLVMLRSGNTGEELVPQWEITLRRIIEQLLIVRPRFKEFLVGYPALFIGGYLLWRGHERFLPIIAFFATIGQSSCIDSFAHLHTPLWVTLLRTFHAFWIGGFIGAAVWFVFRWGNFPIKFSGKK